MGRKLPFRLKRCLVEPVSDVQIRGLTEMAVFVDGSTGNARLWVEEPKERPVKVGWVCWRESPAGGMAALPLVGFRFSSVLHLAISHPPPNSSSPSVSAILLPSVVQLHPSWDLSHMQCTSWHPFTSCLFPLLSDRSPFRLPQLKVVEYSWPLHTAGPRSALC